MRRHVWKWIPKILSREHIRNDEEYYLLKSTLDDLDSGLSVAERERAGRMLLDYEMQHQ
jgi:hypothetical protein